MKNFINNIKVGFFLARKSIVNNNKLINISIISVMVMAFLNLVVVSGILVGLIQGNDEPTRTKYVGDLIITRLDTESKIKHSQDIYSILNDNPLVLNYNSVFSEGGKIEANYKNKGSDEPDNIRSVNIIGINPESWDRFGNLSNNIVEGEYLNNGDSGYIMIGYNLSSKYSLARADTNLGILRDVGAGSKVRISLNNGSQYEYIVKGIVKLKAGELSSSVFMLNKDLENIANLTQDDISQISIRTVAPEEENALKLKNILVNNRIGDYAKIQTFEEARPEFVIQILKLFTLMGNIFGSIGIVVAVITLSIVIFINVVTKKKQIGIMKGIGINKWSIIMSYIFQSLFFAVIGMSIGFIITFGLLKPSFDKHPIDFPFSDGILVAEYYATFIKASWLVFFAVLSGYFPARLIVKKNTLDSILDR